MQVGWVHVDRSVQLFEPKFSRFASSNKCTTSSHMLLARILRVYASVISDSSVRLEQEALFKAPEIRKSPRFQGQPCLPKLNMELSKKKPFLPLCRECRTA